MTDKLKPCPFCGGEAKVRETGYRKWDGSHRRFYIVECQCCCANIEADTKEEAIKAWNKRSYIDEIVEQLEEEQGKIYKDGVHVANEKSFIHIDDAIAIVKGVQND